MMNVSRKCFEKIQLFFLPITLQDSLVNTYTINAEELTRNITCRDYITRNNCNKIKIKIIDKQFNMKGNTRMAAPYENTTAICHRPTLSAPHQPHITTALTSSKATVITFRLFEYHPFKFN